MVMDEILEMPAMQQARVLRARIVSSVELMHAHLERIAEVNPRINAGNRSVRRIARQGGGGIGRPDRSRRARAHSKAYRSA